MSWIDSEIELGTIKEKTTHTVRFRWDGQVPEDLEVTKLESSCGCTTPTFDKVSGILSAVFKANTVPQHLRRIGKMTSTKRVKIYTNKGDFVLKFKSTIIK